VIVVCGSINLDLVAHVARFVQPGETLAGEGFAVHPGGKGANQAVAAARAGAAVKLVGAVGRDAFAAPALALVQAAGIDVSRVRAVARPTGVALIEVAASGENAIVVVAGANAEVAAAETPDEWLDASTVVVLQNEIPAAANAGLAARARGRGARIVYNAAPARDTDREMLGLASVLVVNATEMRALARSMGLPAEPVRFAEEWVRRGGGAAIVTLGGEGAVAAEPGAAFRLRAPAVAVVDTTGAGDAFVGALAAALDGGLALGEALPRAAAAGALACTRHGAQPSLPDATQIAALAAELALDV
jgi:ribokinase